MEQVKATSSSAGPMNTALPDPLPPDPGKYCLGNSLGPEKAAIRNCVCLPFGVTAFHLMMNRHSPGNKEGWQTFSQPPDSIYPLSGVFATFQPRQPRKMHRGTVQPAPQKTPLSTHIRHLPNSPPLQLQPPATLGQVVLWSNRGLSPCNAIALKRPLPRRLAWGLPENHR